MAEKSFMRSIESLSDVYGFTENILASSKIVDAVEEREVVSLQEFQELQE